MDFLRQPIFEALEPCRSVLLAGMGGGYDIYAAIPLYRGLRSAGKTVLLANLSFTRLGHSTAKQIGDALYLVTDETSELPYFPELHLARWLRARDGVGVPIHCFERTGAAPIRRSYRQLAARLGPLDAVILVDGGTDSLMRGDEPDLGTPEEDMASLLAVNELSDVPFRALACLGFGVDTFHGVCHAHVLQAVAELIRARSFLGAWAIPPDSPEARDFVAALDWVHRAMPHHPSIVSSSIASALVGHFGDHHATPRTAGSQLFINPLMSIYWAFELPAVVRRNLYLTRLREIESYDGVTAAIASFRHEIRGEIRPWMDLPM